MSDHAHNTPARKLRVFLCHASEDKQAVRTIYQKLQRYNIKPWLDEKDLLPGENWEQLIPDVIRKSDIVLICLSHTLLAKEGYGNYEIQVVLEAAKRRPSNTIYHIPFRLDDCEMPSFLAGIHYASNLVAEDFDKLLTACEKRREWLNTTQALNIEPIREKAPEYALNPSTPPKNLSEQTPPQRDLLNTDPGRNGLPNNGAFARDTIDQSIKVEHFDMTTPQNPINVFLSYANEDALLLRQLEAHLSGLKREGLISTWCNRQIMPGSHWAGVIDEHLEQASLILLLVSSDFLASDYCYQIEVKRALEQNKVGKAIVIPLIVRPSDWTQTPLAPLEALPTGGLAVTNWNNPDQAFLNIVSGIRKVVEKISSRSPNLTHVTEPTNKNKPSAPLVRKSNGASRPVPQKPVDAAPQQVSSTNQQNVVAASQGTREPIRDKPDLIAHPPAQQEADMSKQHTQAASPLRDGNAQPSVQRSGTRFGKPFPKTWNVPRRHSAFFTGRSAALNQLFDTFSVVNEAGMIFPQVITGLGGMGKTQVAAEYAYHFREYYKAVLWVRADTQENLLADFRAIADLLKRPQQLLQNQASLMQTMREWFKDQSDWLLIFNNADNLSLIDPFLPGAALGHILATTRTGAVDGWAHRPLRLEKLETEAAALCILRRAGQLTEQQQLSSASTLRVKAALELAELMKGLPLALEQAGAYINDTDCGVSKYLKLYKQYRTEIQIHTYGDELRDYRESVASVWKISRIMVEQSNPAAAELLNLCAFLDPDAIPDELIFNGAPALGPILGPIAGHEPLFDQAFKVLKQYSLLHREVDRDTELTKLSIHGIMQEILIDEMDKNTQRIWAERAVRAVELTFQNLPEPWPLLQTHARKCQQLIAQWQMTFAEAKRLQKWIEKFEEQEQR